MSTILIRDHNGNTLFRAETETYTDQHILAAHAQYNRDQDILVVQLTLDEDIYEDDEWEVAMADLADRQNDDERLWFE